LRRVPGRKLLHGDHEFDLAIVLALLERKVMKLRQLLGGILLRVHPVSHKLLVCT